MRQLKFNVLFGVTLLASFSTWSTEEVNPSPSPGTPSFSSFSENGSQVSILDLVQEALQTDPQYLNKKSQVRSSEALVFGASGLFLPTISASASQTQQGEDLLKQPTKYQSYLLTSQWNLFRFGADAAKRNSSQMQLQSDQASLLEYQIGFESEFSESLFNYIAQRKTLNIQKDQKRSQERLLDIAQQRFKRGFLARQEVDKLSIDLDFIEQEIANSQDRLDSLEPQIRKRLPQFPTDMTWPWRETASQLKIKALEPDTHPSLVARLRSFEAAQSEYSQYNRQFWGSLDLSVQWSRSNQLTPDFSDQGASILTFTIPLFQRFEDWTARKVSFEKMIRSENSMRQVKEDLLARHEQALKTFETQKRNLEMRTKTLAISRALLKDNQARFQQGRASANELSIDQNRVFQAERAAIAAELQVHLAMKNLCSSLGKTLTDCLSSLSR